MSATKLSGRCISRELLLHCMILLLFQLVKPNSPSKKQMQSSLMTMTSTILLIWKDLAKRKNKGIPKLYFCPGFQFIARVLSQKNPNSDKNWRKAVLWECSSGKNSRTSSECESKYCLIFPIFEIKLKSTILWDHFFLLRFGYSFFGSEVLTESILKIVGSSSSYGLKEGEKSALAYCLSS